jgi:hypothetical protein
VKHAPSCYPSGMAELPGSFGLGAEETPVRDHRVRVRSTPDATAFASARGGVVYVRPNRAKCCHGAITTLQVSIEPPADAAAYEPLDSGELDVRYRGPLGPGRSPDEILIELRGRRRPHLVAFWDGCAYKL